MQLRMAVNEAVAQYMELRKRIGWTDSGKSATIQRLAQPFQTGYFTVAVAGKMSSGKSTFINSLIGENLLPTGHFQTTSGITWIVSSNRRLMEVTYADGHMQTCTTNFAKELQKLIAVPAEFDTLPINHINILIKGNNDITTILKKKAGIEVMTGTSSDEDIWRRYIAATPKSRIVDKVVIYLPLPKEYEGWRIVDTPGVGAIGGIQDATKKLLTAKEGNDCVQHVVDAVVILHKGTENIQDESANRFAEDVSKSMGELAKGRLFFVLTHACSQDFQNYKDGILLRASNLFGRRLNIPDERITYVDSFIQRFITDAQNSGRDFSVQQSLSTPLLGWNQEEWKSIKSHLFLLKENLLEQGKEVSNSTIFAELDELARFGNLRDKLYDFLNNEKEQTFNRLMSLIEAELNAYGLRLGKDIKAVSNGLSEIELQIQEAEEDSRQLNLDLVKVQQKASPGAVKKKFAFIDLELSLLSKKSSISEVRTAYLQIIDKGLNAEKDFFEALITDFANFASGFNNQNLIFNSLDLSDLEYQAQKKATTQVTDYSLSVRKLVKEGGFSSDDEYETIYPYTKDQVDSDKKQREFTALVVNEGREHCKSFTKGVLSKVDNFFQIVIQSINEKEENNIKRLSKFKEQIANRDEHLAKLKEQLRAIKEVEEIIEKYLS